MPVVAPGDVASPAVAFLPPPPPGLQKPPNIGAPVSAIGAPVSAIGAPVSASLSDAASLQEASWDAALSRMHALEQQFDKHPPKTGTGRALRKQFNHCKTLIRQAGSTLRTVGSPTGRPARAALFDLARAQRGVETLANDAKAAARERAPHWAATVAAMAAGIAVALAAVALAVLWPAALPIAALTLIIIGVAAGAGLPLSVLVVQLVQLRRANAAAMLSRDGARTLGVLDDIVARAATHAAIARDTRAAELIQQSWRRHIGHVLALRTQAVAAGDNSKFLVTRYASAGGERTYWHYREPQDAVKQGMPPTLPLWGTGETGHALGEGSFNSVQLGPLGLVIRHEKQAMDLLRGAPIEAFADLKSFVGAVRISPGISVARYAGTPLDRLLDRGETVPLSHFRQASHDLKAAHRRHLFHRDIKPSNLTVKKERVHFIDCDSMVDMRAGPGSLVTFGTPRYTSVYQTARCAPIRALKMADEFGFLVSMMEATIDNPQGLVLWLKMRSLSSSMVIVPPPAMVKSWLKAHTIADVALYRFLVDPTSWGLRSTVYLHDLMKWPEGW